MTAPDREAPSTSWSVWAWQAYRDGRLVEANPAAIREAALREAAALCFKNADGITEAVSAFPQIKKRRVLLQRAEQAKVDAAAILSLIQKGGDACAVDPRHAPHEASPGVTAGATQKGAAK